LAHADTQIDESIRLKQQLMDEIDEWMKDASVTQAAAAEVRKVEKFTIERRTPFSFLAQWRNCAVMSSATSPALLVWGSCR